MSSVFRPNRKADDADIIRLNSVGLSLATIAEQLDCHPTTITLRLKSLNILPADTRRAFMESIYLGMSDDQKLWLEQQLDRTNIKDYITKLLSQEYQKTLKPKANP